MLRELTGILKETEDAGVKIISCSKQFQPSFTASIYIRLATYQMMADDFEDLAPANACVHLLALLRNIRSGKGVKQRARFWTPDG